MPFWHGDRPGRPLELGRALGAFQREARALATGKATAENALSTLMADYSLDALAAHNVLLYLEEQAQATGSIPDDRTIVVERFRDEIGDWRVCILSPFGVPVHAPWAMAIERRLMERSGIPVETMYTDDGIVLRLPETSSAAGGDELLADLIIDPDEIDELVMASLPQTSLFSARFRECSARALLLPRRRPDQRTPLWQQRQRAADLLAVASKYPTFPMLLETSRECLQDVFDLPALREVLGQLRSRAIRVVSVDTAKASPFAQSLLFNWIAAFMYEGDSPLAERRAAALSLDRDLLRDLLGAEELRELLDPGALADIELELQLLADGRRARSADELHDVLRKVGDLSAAELDLRCEGGAGPADGAVWLASLVHDRRAILVSVAGEPRYIAAEDAARYRDALGCNVPLGLPRAFTDPVPHPLESLVGRYARTNGPFLVEDLAARFGISLERTLGALAALEAEGRVVRGEFRPNGSGREFSDVDVLRQLRRRSLAALRREVEPVEQQAYARFLLGWHNIPGDRRGLDGLVEALGQLQGAALIASTLESELLPARLRSYRPADLDELCTAGELVWVGAGGLGANDGRIRLCFADQLPVLAQGWEPAEPPSGALHVALRDYLGAHGASFWGGIRAAATGDDAGVGGATDGELLTALWDLVWAGEVTNDSLAPLRALLGSKGSKSARPAGPVRGRPRPGRLTRIGPPLGAGRWSLVAPLLLPAPSATEAAHTTALQLLDRYGVVTREAVLAEGVRGGYASVYGVLKVLEERGQTRRGYFVSGLGAAQFSLPGAVDRLRSLRDVPDRELHPRDAEVPVVLAATDPAQPYGAAISWPDSPGRPARAAGAMVVSRSGVPLVWFDRRSHHLVTFPGATDDTGWAEALAALVKNGRVRAVEVRKVNGEPIAPAMPWAAALLAAGFVEGYKGWSIRA
jgi:ATP-dependent Lhr-like helicase